MLRSRGHNFTRLWAWEGGVNQHRYQPLPYARTDSGKYDLSRFDDAYFDRLRSRVASARDEGFYVAVMLFQGWSIYSHGYGNPWPAHPFNRANNVNGIDGDPDQDGEGKEVHSIAVPAVTRLQEAYLRKVVDTVNDLDNVLYEVTNETAIYSRDWQYHVINYVKEYESKKPRQHPIGITAFDSGREGSMKALLASPADWISPQDDGESGDYMGDPPPADGRKVSIADTDHIYGTGGDAVWVWKTFTRGHNPIYMDPIEWDPKLRVSAADIEGARRAMGQTLRVADRMNLTAMKPAGELASTKYCLADPGREYLVFLPEGGTVTVDLSAAKGELAVEWLHPTDDRASPSGPVPGGARREFKAPFAGAAVLYLKAAEPKRAAVGPLRVHPTNPRYFTDGTKTADGRPTVVYLTGSHTWSNLMDRGPKDPPPAFDFEGYLKLLQDHNHNFIRLWRHEHSIPKDTLFPLPYRRTGPGNALDGKPKYDLSQLNPEFFDRMRRRVLAAGDRGIYLGIMFFKSDLKSYDWEGHPFNAANNVNGINGDPGADGEGWETHTLKVPAVTRLQEAYVRKVVDTVNDLDNVLFEIANEAHVSSAEWQYHMIKVVKEYEAGKAKQHPVGMTCRGDEPDNEVLINSPGDWFSPGDYKAYAEDPAAADGRKVSLLDTDHVFGVGGDRDWIWKAFTRGHNPIYMDIIGSPPGDIYPQSLKAIAEHGEGARRAMGHTRHFAERMDLAAMIPREKLSSTKYCLANPGGEYLVFRPGEGEFTVELADGSYAVEWFDTVNAKTVSADAVGGGRRTFKPPFAGPAALYLKADSAKKAARGPLRVHPDNPRYFADGTGRAVYLTGSHTWASLHDFGREGEKPFDYDGYLDFLQRHDHNFFRMWLRIGTGGGPPITQPTVYPRTGPGKAADGEPRYDLAKFNPAYFERLRERVKAAGDRGIYVAVMFFGGDNVVDVGGNPNWPLHPYRRENNINGIDGDPNGDGQGTECYRLEVPAITALQEAYVKTVVDAVGDLDNVVWEVGNELPGTLEFANHVVRVVKDHERARAKRHPVGISTFSGADPPMKDFGDTPADWVTPDLSSGGDYQGDPPAADGKKVIISDTDHLWGVGGDADWVWKSFTRGLHPIYMDPLDDKPQHEGPRRAMGQTRRFADRMNLAAMKPAEELASTRYCLADAGREYLVYLPKGGAVSVDLSAAKGELAAEWFDPARDARTTAGRVAGGAKRELKAPFDGPAVLYVHPVEKGKP